MIGILGTGWLGFPLAQELIKQGNQVHGTTTSQEKIKAFVQCRITPFYIQLEENGISGPVNPFLTGCESLVIAIPPGLRRNPTANFVAKIKHLIPPIETAAIKHVLFISSTSVYNDHEDFPVITNKSTPDATSEAGKQLLKVEKMLLNNLNFETTILRFGGLFGDKRHPATMLSKRSAIKNPKAPVNLIHLQDCIAIISKLVGSNNAEQYFGKTFNAVTPYHPEKEAYYRSICKKLKLSMPDYSHEIASKGKTIDSSYLVQCLNYNFQNTDLRYP